MLPMAYREWEQGASGKGTKDTHTYIHTSQLTYTYVTALTFSSDVIVCLLPSHNSKSNFLDLNSWGLWETGKHQRRLLKAEPRANRG